MSLLVHGVFVAFLLLGVTWRSQPQLPVEAELWRALPESAVLPEPLPEILPEPLPVVLPPPEPAPEPIKPEVAKPDIALERAEKKRLEKAAREQEALQRQAAEAAARDEQARLQQVENERLALVEKERQAQLRREQARREMDRKQMEQELARQAREELAAEEAQLRGAQRQQQERASRHARLVGEFQDRIRSKILGYVNLPLNLAGNPEVIFKVRLLPNGEVLSVTLLRSSGQPAYDREMERVILKASPLPLPNEREVAAVFREDLILKFRPRDE
jgi:colicin import membrane protein